MRWLRERGST